jgi:hypothetical protein
MESIDFWKLNDNFTIVQATLLILDIDPTGEQEWVLKSDVQNRPVGFDAIYSGIVQAIKNKTLNATLRYDAHEQGGGYAQEPTKDEEFAILAQLRIHQDGNYWHDEITTANVIYRVEPSWLMTTIHVEDLKQWLSSRNFTSSKFFFGEKKSNEPDYMNPQHLRYSEELAAAVKVWQAMEDENLLLGKSSPKSAMIDWLESRYKELGLIYEGAIGKKRIEDCAKVANWSDSRSNKTSKKANLPTP